MARTERRVEHARGRLFTVMVGLAVTAGLALTAWLGIPKAHAAEDSKAQGAWSGAPPMPDHDDSEPFRGEIAKLPDGRVVAIGTRAPEETDGDTDPCGDDPLRGVVYVFDPADGESGSWTSKDSAPCEMTAVRTVTLLAGGTERCGDNCGKVLVSFRNTTDYPRSQDTTFLIGKEFGPSVMTWMLYDPANDEWSPTGEKAFGHGTGHETARIRGSSEADCGVHCGKVLVAGGRDPDNGAAFWPMAELYDPATNTWQTVPPMTGNKSVGPVRMIPFEDGRVLTTSGNLLEPVAELFDPAASSWVPTTPPRNFYGENATATRLEDGRVLFAGGNPPEGAIPRYDARQPDFHETDKAEIYDSATQTWTPIGSCGPCGGHHTATRLSSGKVLLASSATDGSLLYDPGVADPGRAHELAGEAGNPADEPTPDEIDETQKALRNTADESARGAEDDLDEEGEQLDQDVVGSWMEAPPPPRKFKAIGSAPATVLLTGGRCGTNCDKMLLTGGPGNDAAALFDETASAAPATVTGVEPLSGADSGSMVRVTGSGFWGDVSVRFGDQRAVSVTVHSPWALTAVTPSGEGAGAAAVRVINGSGRPSRVGPASQFEYARAHGGAWASAEAMAACDSPSCEARYEHSATRLDGPQCRGKSPEQWCGKVLVAGGSSTVVLQNGTAEQGEVFASTLLYDPSSGQWEATGSLNTARFAHTATLLDGPDCAPRCGQVLVVGGATDEGDDEEGGATAELYDPETGTWTAADDLSTPRFAHTATLLDRPGCGATCGDVLVAGGTQDFTRRGISSVELYDPTSDTWRDGEALDQCGQSPSCQARTDHTATLLGDGRVVVAGGRGSQHSTLDTSQVYDPAAGGWQPAPELGAARVGHTATSLTGENCGELCGTVLVTGRLIAQRGSHGVPVFGSSAEVFDPEMNDGAGGWRAVAGMHAPRAGHTATRLADGSVLTVGGTMPWDLEPEQDREARMTAERFDPASGRWSYTDSLTDRRGLATATRLDAPACRSSSAPAFCGRVLVAGGAGPSDNGRYPPPVGSAEVFGLAPAVTGVEPAHGPVEGGTAVTITGARFHEVTEVRFGDTPARSYEVESPSKITAVSPEHEAGPVTVTVTTTGGGSSATPAAQPQAGFRFVDAPARVDDLTATASSTSETELSFSAPADGLGGLASRFQVAHAREPIEGEAAFEAADKLCGGVCDVEEAERVTIDVGDLAAGTEYYYALKAVNDRGQVGPLSNPASARTAADAATDAAPPGRVADLSATALSASRVELAWSAPGQSGDQPPPAGEYVIKQSRAPITADTFDEARSLCEPTCSLAPGSVGDGLTFEVTDLAAATEYYYAVKAVDDAGNEGPMSEAVSIVTLADTATPARVADLEATAVSPSEIELSWSAPDDGQGAPAGRFVVKQREGGGFAGEGDFADAVTLCGDACVFEPGAVGETIELTVTDLAPATDYAYALKAVDDAGNVGPRSNTAQATTAGDATSPAAGDEDGTQAAAVDAAEACAGEVPPAPFADRAAIAAVHRGNVDCAYDSGIALGRTVDGERLYLPLRAVRRDQMASFIARAMRTAGYDFPEPGEQGFADVAGNTHADNINRLAAAGVTQGTTADTYSPAALVRRDQMASFLVRAAREVTGNALAPPEQRRFEDSADTVHGDAVEAGAAAGLIQGTQPDVYGNAAPTSRQQMATFLTRLLAYAQQQ